MNKQNPAVMYGLIGAAILMLFGIGMQMYIMSSMEKMVASGESVSPMKFLGFGIISLLVVAGVYLFCIIKSIKDYRKVNPDYTYKKLVGQGLLTTLIIALVSTAFSLLYSQVIDPVSRQKTVELSERLIENSNMPDDQKEKTIDGIKNQDPVKQAVKGLAWTLCCGLIVSLIAGSVLNKQGKDFPANPNNLA